MTVEKERPLGGHSRVTTPTMGMNPTSDDALQQTHRTVIT